MKIGAVNDYRNKVEDEIRWISSKGFDYVDMTLEPVMSSGVDVSAVKGALDETGLSVIGHTSPSLPLVFPLKSIRKPAWDEFIKYADIFEQLPVKYVTLHPSLNMPLIDKDKMFKYNREMIERADRIMRDRGMTLILESFLTPFDTPSSFKRLLEGLDKVEVHVDVGHCNISDGGNCTESFFKQFGERIVHVHFSDNYGRIDAHNAVGDGNIDWKKIVEVMLSHGYDNTITLEVFTGSRKDLVSSKDKIVKILGEAQK
jgi:sugar phosphate isomerase/epimerase